MDNNIYSMVTTEEAEILAVVASIFMVVLLVVAVVQLVLYVFRSLGLYQIAKRRGLSNAWLAWIPLAWYWTAGSMSDQYQLTVRNKKHCYRLILLLLQLGVFFCGGLQSVSYLTGMLWETFGLNVAFNVPMALGVACSVLAPVLSIAALVFKIMVFYDVYRSCDPDKALVFCILGSIFGFLDPFFLFACRNKDEGMPVNAQ